MERYGQLELFIQGSISSISLSSTDTSFILSLVNECEKRFVIKKIYNSANDLGSIEMKFKTIDNDRYLSKTCFFLKQNICFNGWELLGRNELDPNSQCQGVAYFYRKKYD